MVSVGMSHDSSIDSAGVDGRGSGVLGSAFQHLMRVINTDEAQELGREVGAATERISKEIGGQVHQATQPPAQDAGPSQVPEVVSNQVQGIVGHSFDRDQRIESARQREVE
jgi:ubiquinone biosynthesis protein UbiJ